MKQTAYHESGHVAGSGNETNEKEGGMELQGYMRKEDVAKYLGVTPRTISRLMRRKKLPFHKLSRRLVLFRLRDVDAAMDRLKFNVPA
jgi:excisionase family DNA binding protein